MQNVRSVIAIAISAFLAAPPFAYGASHREAPITALDHPADITDFYAFVSYDDPTQSHVHHERGSVARAGQWPELFSLRSEPGLHHQDRQHLRRHRRREFRIPLQDGDPRAWRVPASWGGHWHQRSRQRTDRIARGLPVDSASYHRARRRWRSRLQPAPDLHRDDGDGKWRHCEAH